MAKQKPNDKNMHDGHRKRVVNSYSQIELDSLSPHQVLEYILFYVFPRGDVNPLAHRLLDPYGSVQNVLDANPNELTKIYGVSERSAQMITGLTKIFNYYTCSKLAKRYRLSNPTEIFDYCEDLLRFYNQEVLFAIALDASFNVVMARKIGKGDGTIVGIDTHEICDYINETKAVHIILTHNHPGGYCKPTQNDIDGTTIIRNVANFMNCNFIDHVIIGSDGVYSIVNDQKVRDFATNEDMEELVEKFKQGE